MLELYDYFRSSASLRVCIALNLKQLDYTQIPIHLLNNGGEQFSAAYCALNPQALVPCLKHDGVVITQSLAIMEYLEEIFPKIPLLPFDRDARAYVRSIAQSIACDIHPLNNLRVIKYLEKLGLAHEDRRKWPHHWLELGLTALETRLQKSLMRGKFCYQDQPTIADACLIPQLFNAKRFHFDLSPFPTLLKIEKNCLAMDEFSKVLPEL